MHCLFVYTIRHKSCNRYIITKPHLMRSPSLATIGRLIHPGAANRIDQLNRNATLTTCSLYCYRQANMFCGSLVTFFFFVIFARQMKVITPATINHHNNLPIWNNQFLTQTGNFNRFTMPLLERAQYYYSLFYV